MSVWAAVQQCQSTHQEASISEQPEALGPSNIAAKGHQMEVPRTRGSQFCNQLRPAHRQVAPLGSLYAL